jgi:beta-mannosidase
MAKPFNMGSMYWQMNDVWPVVSWSSVDSYGEYKASHYSMKALHANVLVGVKLLPS